MFFSWIRKTLSRRKTQSNGTELGGRVRLKTRDLWYRGQVHRHGGRVRVWMFFRVYEEQTWGVTSVWRLVILCVNNTLVPARTRMSSEIVLNFQQTFRLFSVSFSRHRHQRMRATGDLQQWAVYQYSGKFSMFLSAGLRFGLWRKTLYRYGF